MAKKKCAHDGCVCEAEAGSEYCSKGCELDAKVVTSKTRAGACRCGHAGCGGRPSHPDKEAT